MKNNEKELELFWHKKFNEGKEDAANGKKPAQMTKAYITGYNKGLIIWQMKNSQEDF